MDSANGIGAAAAAGFTIVVDPPLPSTYLSLIPATSTSQPRGGILTEMVNVNNLVNPYDSNQGLYAGNIVIVYNTAFLSASSTDVTVPSGSPISTLETVGVTQASATFTNFVNPNGTPVTLAELDISLTGVPRTGPPATTGYTGTSGGNLLQINFHVNTAAPFGAQSVVDLAPNDNVLGGPGAGAGPLAATTYLTDQSQTNNYTLVYPSSSELTFSGVTGGTFAVGVNGTTASGISWSANATTLAGNIQSVLGGLGLVTANGGSVTVASNLGSPIITFVGGNLANTGPVVTIDDADGGADPNSIFNQNTSPIVNASDAEPVDGYYYNPNTPSLAGTPISAVSAGPQDSTLTVTGTDTAPVANANYYNVVPNGTLVVTGNTGSPDNGVLGNATDTDLSQTVSFTSGTTGAPSRRPTTATRRTTSPIPRWRARWQAASPRRWRR